MFLTGDGERKMKLAKLTRKLSLILACAFIFALGIFAQKSDSKQEQTSKIPAVPEDQKETVKNVSDKKLSEEESAILPYYNNYLKEYHLGPEDVISVEVFGQPTYSKASIIIPPTSRIAYPLIPGGVSVGGKTVEQVSEEIKKRLNEYIIDPEVTVTLDKVGSARFSVLGKVVTPGVKMMNRRYNIYEAVAEAGGIANEGDKKRVLLVRLNQQGGFTRTVINFEKLLSGKTEVTYLIPGDQIIVPEKKWSLRKILDIMQKASAARILFGAPF
jgi:protein involved in polysaccharide export with SLBB domain